MPPTHVAPRAHSLPQNPQFCVSLLVFEHPVVQHCSSRVHAGPPLQLVGTWHRFPTHASPGGQALPQLPQSSGLFVSFTQSEEQHDRPAPQARPVPQAKTHSSS
jgi:hypothetical protein